MKKIFKKLIHGFSHSATNLLARSDIGRRFLQHQIQAGQKALGIGTSGNTSTTGEQVIVRLLLQRAPRHRPFLVLDVGANQGQFLQMLVNGLGEFPFFIHSFEPSPSTFALINHRFGKHPQVTLNPFGLGKQTGNFPLFSDSPGSGLASLTKRRLDNFDISFDRVEHVRIEKLDDYCLLKGIEEIDLLKIDVEGHELDVLEGASRLFHERRIRMVTFEFGGTHIDTRTFFRDFYLFFQKHKMLDIYRITPCDRLFPIKQYSESLEQFQLSNYLVLPQAA